MKIPLYLSLFICCLFILSCKESSYQSELIVELPETPSESDSLFDFFILFPTKPAIATSESITLRGTSNGINISSLKINDIEAESLDNFLNWQATIPLNTGENTLIITIKDNTNKIFSFGYPDLTLRREASMLNNFSDAISDLSNHRIIYVADDDHILSILNTQTEKLTEVLLDNTGD